MTWWRQCVNLHKKQDETQGTFIRYDAETVNDEELLGKLIVRSCPSELTVTRPVRFSRPLCVTQTQRFVLNVNTVVIRSEYFSLISSSIKVSK